MPIITALFVVPIAYLLKNMCRMRWECCKDSGGTNNKEYPVDVVRQVLVQVESTGAIREVEDRRSSAIVEGEPADGGVDVPR